MPRYETTGHEWITGAAAPNGWLQTIWIEGQLEPPPKQIYATAVHGGMRKGPHLHRIRCGRFFVLTGRVIVRVRCTRTEEYTDHALRAGDWLQVSPGDPAAIYGVSPESILLNFPSPSWPETQSDDHVVTGWVDPPLPAERKFIEDGGAIGGTIRFDVKYDNEPGGQAE